MPPFFAIQSLKSADASLTNLYQQLTAAVAAGTLTESQVQGIQGLADLATATMETIQFAASGSNLPTDAQYQAWVQTLQQQVAAFCEAGNQLINFPMLALMRTTRQDAYKACFLNGEFEKRD